ncbi:hypothetical protein EXU85_33530 [Spirosoma sp. KCTC 42546]|uniref:hypothetical protein n=1 Tax=Spirosoma sp. KCTC 42546 TaxID=2520506 RepID=UPI00115ACF41|nr:hypothetical protein [Spirosoma sp. KCTC 42546]QDK83259.1 hypothetical protein EXU85_33530 [Spirosoma sp. KCTC 42546]
MKIRLLPLVLIIVLITSADLQAQSTGSDTTQNQPAKGQQTYHSISRSSEDSSRSIFNFKAAPIYVRTTPFSIYTGAGSPKDRIAQSIELGKSFNVIDLGIAFGRNSLRPDTSLFLEGRVTMDVANYGIFANEMTIGAGRVFDKQGSLMLELTYSIMAQIAPRVGIGLTTGYYDFSSETTDSSKTFYGIYLRFGLLRTDSGGLLGGSSRGRGRPVRVGRPHRHGR